MWQQFLTKRYWLRAAKSFLIFLALYTVVTYLFRGDDESFWSLSELQSRFSFALFMATIFAYRHGEYFQTHKTNNDTATESKWNVKNLFSIFGGILLFAIPIITILFALSWLVSHFLTDYNEPIAKVYLNSVLTTTVMCLLTAFFLFICGNLGVRWESRS